MNNNLLTEAGWQEEKPTTFLYWQPKCRLILELKTNFLRFDIVLLGEIVLFLKIKTTENQNAIFQIIVKYQAEIKEKREQLLTELLAQKGVSIQLRKYFQGKAYFIPLKQEELVQLKKPNWERIQSEQFNFYLGSPVQTQLLITPKNQLLAYQYLLNLVNNQHSLFTSFKKNTFSNTSTLGDFFNEYSYVEPIFDANKNIIGLKQGGDEWVFELLELITAFIEKDSFIIIQDDGAVFWKVVYHLEKVEYFREKLT